MFEFGVLEDERHQCGAWGHADLALQGFEKGFSVFLTILPGKILEGHLIANEFAFCPQARAYPPGERIEPVKSLHHEDEPATEKVMTFYVGQLVKDDSAHFVFGIILQEIGRNDEATGAKEAIDCDVAGAW